MYQRLAMIALVLACLPAGVAVSAQGIFVPERPDLRGSPFSVKSVRVSATIADGIAETTVEQTFVNEASVDQEGTYLFPLPDGAGVTSFSLRAGDKVIEGRLLGKDEARSVYESIVRRRRDPALLEYVGRGLFRSSVFPIPAHGERILTLRYAEVLRTEGGLKRYSYSLSTGKFSIRPVEISSVSVKLRSSSPLRTVYSPSHDVSVRRTDDHTATASWEARGEFPERDFVLYYGTGSDDVGLSLITYQTGGQDGYFMLIAAPRFTVAKEKILPKRIVYVLDRTGSMQPNGKMEQAKAAMHYCISNLNPQDRFDVITFNESPDVLTRTLVPATPENLRKAEKFVSDVDASGGTNIDEALKDALGLLKEEQGSEKMVVFVTDGQPTVGETNIDTILANVRRMNGPSPFASGSLHIPEGAAALKARIFCFGVGYDVNVPFLDRLAEENRADADYVRPGESVESVVSAFYSKVSSPILSNVRLAFDGAEVYDVYPKVMPDLFKGNQLVVAGRYRGTTKGGVRLTGVAQDRQESFALPSAFDENSARNGLVPRIWATRKIGYLLDQVRLHSNQEVVDEIVRLSKEYGIMTPYTAYLADERQDAAVTPLSSNGAFSYRLDAPALQQLSEDAKKDLFALGRKSRGEVGADETHRALNSKGYQNADRAPAGSQGLGGLGGGGVGGGGRAGGVGGFGAYQERERKPGSEIARNKVALDYLSSASAGGASGPESGRSQEPGYKQIQQNSRIQAVAGRVFYRRGNVWMDNNYQAGRRVVKIQNLSEAHFQVLRALPELNRLAAVGDEVVVDLGKVALQFGAEGKQKLTESELKDLTGK